ncbi:MAG: hypothetical protein ACRC1D_05845 [Culicoidibacterales bacterium]
MTFRNSKLELFLSFVTASFNAVLSLVLLALLTTWSLVPFAAILTVLFIVYSGFTFLTWQAERIEVTQTQVFLTFGLKTKTTTTLARNTVTFERLRTKRFHQLCGLVRCQLRITPEQKITLTLRTQTALELENQFNPVRLELPQAVAKKLKFSQLPLFILNETRWLTRSSNLFCLFLIGAILLVPQQLLLVRLWQLLLGFIAISLIVLLVGATIQWLQTRYFTFVRDGDTFFVQSGFLQPKTATFSLTDFVMIEQKQALFYPLHRHATISLALEETKKLTKNALILAPIINEAELPDWFDMYFPEIERNSRQYRPTKSAWLSFFASLPVLITLVIGLLLFFFTTVENQTIYLMSFFAVLGLVFLDQYWRWQSSYLCQLPDWFILDLSGLTHSTRYYPKQYTQARISQSRYQAKRGLGTFHLSFPNQTLASVTLSGLSQKHQS